MANIAINDVVAAVGLVAFVAWIGLLLRTAFKDGLRDGLRIMGVFFGVGVITLIVVAITRH